jgi:hypothetical protein
VQALLAQITWYHNIAILEKLDTSEDRIWYAKATIQHGWSRNILVHQIEAGRMHRQSRAVANFDHTLPAPRSELAMSLSPSVPGLSFGITHTRNGQGSRLIPLLPPSRGIRANVQCSPSCYCHKAAQVLIVAREASDAVDLMAGQA